MTELTACVEFTGNVLLYRQILMVESKLLVSRETRDKLLRTGFSPLYQSCIVRSEATVEDPVVY